MFTVWLFKDNSYQPVFVDAYLPYSKSGNAIFGWNFKYNSIGILIKAIAKNIGSYDKLYDIKF
jgi:hypothetical protein